jgi:hypothetical protein
MTNKINFNGTGFWLLGYCAYTALTLAHFQLEIFAPVIAIIALIEIIESRLQIEYERTQAKNQPAEGSNATPTEPKKDKEKRK